MDIGRAPAEITVVRVNAWAHVGLAVVNLAMLARSFDWSGPAERGILAFSVVSFGLVTLGAIGLSLLPLWLIRRGSRATAVVVTLLGVWSLLPPYSAFDPIVLAILEGAIASSFAVWRPASRAYLRAVGRLR
jgi:hypothetical protein